MEGHSNETERVSCTHFPRPSLYYVAEMDIELPTRQESTAEC